MRDMTEDPQAALGIFAEAVRAVLQDPELVYANPGERAIVMRLALQIEGKFPGWSIGYEWNRREDVAKRLRHGVTEEDIIREGLIIPDIIVHRVGKRANLLVVEVKKLGNNDYDSDIWKLQGLTLQEGEYGYAVGLHLVVDLPKAQVPRCDVYVDGALNESLTGWLRGQLSSPA